MQQISMFMNQVMPLLSLYSDIIACLAAACVLSLVTGWMLHKSRTRKMLDATTRYWEKRHNELEAMARNDAENLEEQLQSMGTDAKALQIHNRMLSDTIKSNDSTAQRSRAEAIELNRQHAETQERLQRIIQQKEREILELGKRINQIGPRSGKSVPAPRSAFLSSADDTDILGDGEMTYTDTVAINTTDMFDATIQMSAHELLAHREESRSDDDLESTIVINSTEAIDMEEATVALDEDVLAFARRSAKPNRND